MTITVTPPCAMRVDDVTVTDRDGDDVACHQAERYPLLTFTMPDDSKVEVEVSFVSRGDSTGA